MTIIEPLYRRLGVVSTLWLAGMAASSTLAQQPVVREAESILVDHQLDEPKRVAPPTVVAAPELSPYAASNHSGSYGFIDRDCRNSQYGRCRHNGFKSAMQDCHWGYPEEFIERPFGGPVRKVLNTQIASGLAAQLVLYRFDFDGDRLSPGGMRHAWRISDKMQLVTAPVIVEPTGNRALDLARRDQVIVFLQQVAQIPIVPDNVVIGYPPVNGLDGDEAIAIQQAVIRNLQMGGAPVYNPEFGEGDSNSGVNSVNP
jgi:hypothetical protein